MDLAHPAERQVAEALSRLEARGLAGAASDAFSARMPGRAAMAVASLRAKPVGVRVVSLDAAASDEPAVALHAAAYRVRGDAGALLTARLPWASRLAQLPEPMPAVFDEQVRQLGPRVEPLATERSQLGEAGAAMLARGANAFLLAEEVLAVGFTPERAVLNAELLEKCAKAYLLARLAGGRIRRIPWLVRYVAGGRLRKDRRRAAQAHARGEVPSPFSTY
jgi:ribulose-5-phosphate 4-epimerase/fuculose-1-phosphate aldolase